MRRGLLALAGLLAVAGAPASVRGQEELTSRQVMLFGIVATPDSNTIDPKLKTIAPQLRKLLPNHGFKLLKVESKRLGMTDSMTCDFGSVGGVSYAGEAQLLQPLDFNGKVQLKVALSQRGQLQAATIVTTPPNQLFFIDKMLSNDSRLIIGIGAR